MLTKTKITLAAALILSTASAAWASDSGENHQDNDRSVISANAGGAKAFGFAVSADSDEGGQLFRLKADSASDRLRTPFR